MTITPFEHLYQPSDEERRAFGSHWIWDPATPPRQEAVCAYYEHTNEEGRDVYVYRTAAPAAFYRVEAGDLSLDTGTGQDALVASLAAAIAGGMIKISQRIPLP